MNKKIFGVFQKQFFKDEWQTLLNHNIKLKNDILLFSWLIGTYKMYQLKPISTPRGLPKDFNERDSVGVFNQSWLTSSEILKAVDDLEVIKVSDTHFINPRQLLYYFIKDIEMLQNKFGEIRFVFGFV